jgi:hypothetical protein
LVSISLDIVEAIGLTILGIISTVSYLNIVEKIGSFQYADLDNLGDYYWN